MFVGVTNVSKQMKEDFDVVIGMNYGVALNVCIILNWRL